MLSDGLLCLNDFFERWDVEVFETGWPLLLLVVAQLLVDVFFHGFPCTVRVNNGTEDVNSLKSKVCANSRSCFATVPFSLIHSVPKSHSLSVNVRIDDIYFVSLRILLYVSV